MDELLNRYFADLMLEGKRPQTLTAYQMRLRDYLHWLADQGLLFEQVDHDQILAYKRHLQAAGHKPATVRAYLTTVAALYQWTQSQGLLSAVPVSKLDYPALRPKRVRRLTDAELQLFTSYIDQLQENLRAAFWCLLGTGARVSEVAKLRRTNVSLRGHAVYVAIEDAKWGSDRTIPVIHPTAAAVVWRFCQTVDVDNKPLFRVTKRTLQLYARQFMDQTGIPFRCHLLRHTFAAKLVEEGVPITTVQYLLGHKSVGMTAYYAQSALVDLSDITPKIETETDKNGDETDE